MPTYEELHDIYDAPSSHPDGLRAVYEAGVAAGVAAERERCARIATERARIAAVDVGLAIRRDPAQGDAAIRADREPEPAAKAVAQGWDEGFEAGATWPQHTPGGTPVDPPVNPYRKEQTKAIDDAPEPIEAALDPFGDDEGATYPEAVPAPAEEPKEKRADTR